MPLLLAVNVNAAPHLIYNVESISARSASSSTDSTISAAIPAIAGGTAAGVVLAVVAVMGWKWWTFRYPSPKRQSSSSRRNVLRRQNRAIPTKSNEIPLSSTMNTNCNSASCQKPEGTPVIATPPHPTTNHYPMITTTPAPLGPPTKPPRNPARALRRSSKENTARANRSSFTRASHRLSYKASTVSTASVYSTESEEQQTRVPAAVIVAALGHTFGTRRLSTLHHNPRSYTIGEEQIDSELVLPHQRLRHSAQNDNVDLHRISNISDGSLGLQDGPYTIDPIGVAYSGEECEEQFYIPEGSLDREMAHSTDIH